MLALTPLLLLRMYGALGFDLLQAGPTWIRGIDLTLASTVGSAPHLFAVWLHAVPGSSLMPGAWLRVVWALLVYIGIAFGLLRPSSREARWGTGLLVAFVSLYALSPVYESGGGHQTGIGYRHLAYISPLMVLLAMNGLSGFSRRTGNGIAAGIIILGIGAGFTSYSMARSAVPSAAEGVGIVLAWKLGHDVPRLLAIIDASPFGGDPLMLEGVGTGYASAIVPTGDIATLVEKIGEHPTAHHEALKRGILKAFGPAFAPRPPAELLPEVRRALERVGGSSTTRAVP